MNYPSASDEMLLVYLRTGDEKAFREIYLRYWKKLYGIARCKLDAPDTVEEVLQEIFLKLWERRGELRIERLDAYLFTAVRYAVINHFKSVMIRERHADYVYAHQPEMATATTDEQMELDELLAVVDQQLNDLPAKTQLIFRLNRLEHRSVRDVATYLNMPERTVEYHLSHAIKTLRTYLRDYLLPGVLLLLSV